MVDALISLLTLYTSSVIFCLHFIDLLLRARYTEETFRLETWSEGICGSEGWGVEMARSITMALEELNGLKGDYRDLGVLVTFEFGKRGTEDLACVLLSP